VAETMDPKVSRITIVTQANQPLLEQIEKQLRKLINVIKLRDMSDDHAVRREMALICVNARPKPGRDPAAGQSVPGQSHRCGLQLLHHRGQRRCG
jgi:acetolactate synthase small subunit